MTAPADSRVSDAVLDEIEFALGMATPGPWVKSWRSGLPVNGPSHEIGSPTRGIAISMYGEDAAYVSRLDPETVRALITELRERRAQAVTVPDAVLDALNWALGCNGDFHPQEQHVGAYWWRAELQKRAGLIYDKSTGQFVFASPPPAQAAGLTIRAVEEIKALVVAAFKDPRLAKSNLNAAAHKLNDLIVALSAQDRGE